MDDMKRSGSVSVAPTSSPAREFDTLCEMQHQQLAAMTGLMRRVEDLANRLLGAAPAGKGTKSAGSKRSGWLGGLLDAQEMRDEIIIRTGDALDRIEKVL